jgi:hypothetical protein
LVEHLVPFRLGGHSYPWIGDAALAQEYNARGAAEAFQLWTLTIKPDHTATLACEDGNGKPVFAKAIACTDLPLLEIRLYYTDRTILLPSGYGGRPPWAKRPF